MKKFIHFPLTKIILGIVIVGGCVALGQMGSKALLNYLSVAPRTKNLITGIVASLLAIYSYILLFRAYEKRVITELQGNNLRKNLLFGLLLGALLQSLTILVIYLYGGFSVLSVNPVSFLLPAFTMAFTSAIIEEVIVRGIVFRVIEQSLGSFYGLVISALIFGALHLANPNSSPAAAIGLALQAGVFLAAAFIYSKNLWFPIAIHFSWNFTQSGLFGASVSGNATGKSLLTTKIEGSEYYTGGEFGPEASIQATVFCFTAAIILLVISHKQNKLVPPFWKRNFS